MRHRRPARLAAVATLATLAPLTPLTLGSPAIAATSALTLSNPGFEDGATGWTFTSGTGVATNAPHGGAKLAYLDAGSGNKVAQTITASGDGTYDFSAWIATGGPGEGSSPG